MKSREKMSEITDISANTGGIGLFSDLVYHLGTHTKTNDKLDALIKYFAEAGDQDKVWMIALFSGRRPRRTISGSKLAEWCSELIGLPLWLFEESYHTVGDLSETIALLIPEKSEGSSKSLSWYVEKFQELEKSDEAAKKEFIIRSWEELNSRERFVFNKLLSSTFRVGVSQSMMIKALAKRVNLESSVIAHRISGNWDPATTPFEELLSHQPAITDHSKPYPFYLAYALEQEAAALGEPAEWQAEWKWDGIRGQIIKRNGLLFVWSRGEDLITDKFPEYKSLTEKLPDGTVLDGEILPVLNGQALNFNLLQTRIGRKNITKKQLEEAPAGIFVYDLLEQNGEDIRHLPLKERRQRLAAIVADVNLPNLILSPIVEFHSWEQLAALRLKARDNNSEGLMLKRKSSPYQVGRKRGDWWKWKIDPLTIDAVMIYAQKGTGRRSNLYTDYTFAVRDGDKLDR
jgi:DNA ligase-1